MKNLEILKYNFLTIGLISALAASGTDISRVIKKNYTVKANTTLAIKNSFGKIHLENWDKNQFDIEVEIIGKSGNDQRAKEIADRIEIEIRESSDIISLETELNGLKTKNRESFEVNYSVKLPAGNPIDIKNSFGDMYLDDRNGPVELDISYGAIKAGDLNEESEVRVAFGKGYFGHFSSGEVEIKYSDFEVQSSNRLRMDQQFSNIEISTVGILDLESKYGSVEIGEVQEIEVDVEFSRFTIDEVGKSIIMEASYVSDFEIGVLRKEFELVDIEGKFSSLDIRLEEGLSADFDAYFEYADLKDYADIDFHYRVRDNNENEYRGKIGGGSSSKRISIRSEYGNCRIMN